MCIQNYTEYCILRTEISCLQYFNTVSIYTDLNVFYLYEIIKKLLPVWLGLFCFWNHSLLLCESVTCPVANSAGSSPVVMQLTFF